MRTCQSSVEGLFFVDLREERVALGEAAVVCQQRSLTLRGLELDANARLRSIAGEPHFLDRPKDALMDVHHIGSTTISVERSRN